MSLQQRLDNDLRDAMRSRDKVRLNVIRQIKAAVTNAEIKEGGQFDDAKVHEVISRLVRQHRESIELFTKGHRQDLRDNEEAELRVLQSYLPQQMSSDEVRALARQAAEQVGARGPADKGKVMGKLMPQLKGKADGAEVNKVVMELLESLAK